MSQLEMPGMPRRLFSATPSKLASYADCPRRYRFNYVDRPTPPKGPPWAHNSLGASVHTALRSWWDLPSSAAPRAGPASSLLLPPGSQNGYRDAEQSRRWRARAAGWLTDYVAGLDPTYEPVAIERTVGAKTDAGPLRPDRPHRPARRRAGHRRLQDRPRAVRPTTTPAGPGAGALCAWRRSAPSAARAIASSCTTCPPARSPRTSTPTSRSPATSAGPSTPRATSPRRTKQWPRAKIRTSRSRPPRDAVRLVRLPVQLPHRAGGRPGARDVELPRRGRRRERGAPAGLIRPVVPPSGRG